MRRNFSLAVLLAVALSLFAAAFYVYRPAQSNLMRVTVLGDSQTKVAPDSAVIIFSVVTQNTQAVNAQQENARKSEAVKKAVETTAVNSEIKTTDYSLRPEQDYSYSRMPKIIGYEARNSVKVTINDLNQTGAVIDAATKAGANSVEGISFVLRENSPARGDALALATRQAIVKSESIAQSLNGRVVRVIEITEGGIAPQSTGYNQSWTASTNSNATMSARSSYATPVEAGSLNVHSQVLLVVEIEVKK